MNVAGCWDAYFELNKTQQELPKEEITRMVKDSEGDVRYLIVLGSITRSNLRKNMAEKVVLYQSHSSSPGGKHEAKAFPCA
ncbi:hypothetical protein HU200_012899 [Digitaria exilis]|uniref:Uncharacterized protein n=1 Tax=Digitaria exilis TaxID=1010633 RepID=A0A835FEM2_9POAL|nr:hypothetical protein HU200_012899 [Digitaria exilis]